MGPLRRAHTLRNGSGQIADGPPRLWPMSAPAAIPTRPVTASLPGHTRIATSCPLVQAHSLYAAKNSFVVGESGKRGKLPS